VQGENVHEPNYGCKAVQREWEWSGRRSLLARSCMHNLLATVQVRCCPVPYVGGTLVYVFALD